MLGRFVEIGGGVAVVVGVWLRGGLVVFVVLGWFFGGFFLG